MNKELKKAIKHHLVDEDISQKEFAVILGVKEKYLSNIMIGSDPVSGVVLERLNKILEIEMTQEVANQ